MSSSGSQTLIIVPTYNEIENIRVLIPQLMALPEQVHVLVVDDNSPDQTGAEVKKLQQAYQTRLHLLERAGKEGLGRAYLAGFSWALRQNYSWIVEMDADFSHRPQDLQKIIQSFSQADFIVGSRYVSGGGTVNWGLLRKIISRGGSIYSRLILGFPINDWTGGFNAWSRKALEKMDLEEVRSNGYSFQIELKYRASRRGFIGKEVPILFEDRRVGQSKMSFKIVLEALYKVWLMKWEIK
ncbi:MAG: polyprenol monophosphomannose synthase [Pseudobdellovibrionaceae bacterium]|jgi:dolichol-phosphate mannosyltransferase